jgi:proline iminopeptidase
MRRFFDPERYRVVLFDQRNCGRSTPHAGDPAVDLASNTTWHLAGDIEQLREHLGIERWLVYGSSWGVTLGLAYAEAHPGHVSAAVFSSVTNTTRAEIDWLYHGVGRFFPEPWLRFREGVPAEDRDGDLVEAYGRLLESPDPAIREEAARRWCEWEDQVVKLSPADPPNPRYEDARFRMAFARIVTHYFGHGAWLVEGQLLQDAHRLSGIPGILIHGRLDLGSPLKTAWDLHRAWPGSQLVVVDAGHLSSERGMTEAIVAALDRMASGTALGLDV